MYLLLSLLFGRDRKRFRQKIPSVSAENVSKLTQTGGRSQVVSVTMVEMMVMLVVMDHARIDLFMLIDFGLPGHPPRPARCLGGR